MAINNQAEERGVIREKLRKLEHEVQEMRDDVREIRDVVVSVRGGWKTLAVIAAISSVIGGLVVKLTAWLIYLPK